METERTDEEIKKQVEELQKVIDKYSNLSNEDVKIQIDILLGDKELCDIDDGDWENMDRQNKIFRAAEKAANWLEDINEEDLFS